MILKLLSAILVVTLISFLLQWWQPQFLYVREAVTQGEWWRILTGQLVHTNWPHFALNVSSLALFALLFYNTACVRTFTINLFLLVCGVGVCIHLLEPEILWYAGLSGAIYGLYITGAYHAYVANDRFTAIAVVILVLAKVFSDHWFGPLQDNSELIEARVVTESHLYGVISAVLLCGLDAIYRHSKPTTQLN